MYHQSYTLYWHSAKYLLHLSGSQFVLSLSDLRLVSRSGLFHPNQELKWRYAKLAYHYTLVIGITAAKQYSVLVLKAFIARSIIFMSILHTAL